MDINKEAWGLLISQLEEVRRCVAEHERRVDEHSKEIAMLTVKASLWGALAGAIVVLIPIAIWILRKWII